MTDVERRLNELIVADLPVTYEITPAQPYTEADLDWHDTTYCSSIEVKNSLSRPQIANRVEKFEPDSVVYIGFPIWWNSCPPSSTSSWSSMTSRAIWLSPFATSGGTTIDKAADQLQKHFSAATWQQGLLLNNVKDEELEQMK